MTGLTRQLARWASSLEPTAADLELAQQALVDTVAVTLAGRDHPIADQAAGLPEAARWAAMGHVLDFDDLHLPSTTHVSVVCVPAVLACGGDARAYLGGAGVMARLGTLLGWPHYTAGWHITCTAGAPAAAVAAALSLGLDADRVAQAMALAVPAAGGVHRAFGTAAKALQVGFAAQAGVRAAALVAAGADADPRALEQWLALMGVTAPADPSAPDPSASDLSAPDIPGLDLSGPAVPGGLAVKLFPCCYSLQRPITALRGCLGQGVTAAQVRGIRVSCPASAVEPLVFHRPRTGLEAKFSLEYALAATVLDGCPGPASFSTEAVRRPAAVDLMGRVELVTKPGGDGLLAGTTEVELILSDGTVRHRAEQIPPGAPARPAGQPELRAKLDRCGSEVSALVEGMTWADASSVLASWPVGAMAS